MTGLDTNLLVRFFMGDHPEESRRAASLMASLSAAEPGWVGLTTLLEFVWVLKSVKRLDRARIVLLLGDLLTQNSVVVEQRNAVESALQKYRNGRADFADCLIAASAKAAGCARTVTFDRIAARDAGMELVQ